MSLMVDSGSSARAAGSRLRSAISGGCQFIHEWFLKSQSGPQYHSFSDHTHMKLFNKYITTITSFFAVYDGHAKAFLLYMTAMWEQNTIFQLLS